LEFSPIHDLKKKWTLRVHTKEQETFCKFLGVFQAQPLWIAHMFLWCIIKFLCRLFYEWSVSFSQSLLHQQLIWEVGHLLHLSSWLDFYQTIVHFYWRQCVSKVMVYSFPSPLKVGVGTPSFGCSDLHLPFVYSL
jgi:hypothetical protein